MVYLGYKKIKELMDDEYDVGEQGELVTYDRTAPMILPSSERNIK